MKTSSILQRFLSLVIAISFWGSFLITNAPTAQASSPSSNTTNLNGQKPDVLETGITKQMEELNKKLNDLSATIDKKKAAASTAQQVSACKAKMKAIETFQKDFKVKSQKADAEYSKLAQVNGKYHVLWVKKSDMKKKYDEVTALIKGGKDDKNLIDRQKKALSEYTKATNDMDVFMSTTQAAQKKIYEAAQNTSGVASEKLSKVKREAVDMGCDKLLNITIKPDENALNPKK